MTQAKCMRCGASAKADTYEQAQKLINHAVGRSRGIKCGNNYNMVVEINNSKPKIKPQTKKTKPIPEIKTEPKEIKTEPKEKYL